MSSRLLPCSPSALARYDECPRAYWYEHVARPRPPRPPMTAYRAVGTSVHLALAALWDNPAEPIGAILRRVWIEQPFTDPRRSARWRFRAFSWLRSYVDAGWIDRRRQPLGVERTVSTTTETLALSGRADRIDDRPAGLTIVDYKAGHRAPEPGDARRSQPLALYAIAAGRMFRRSCRHVELHHLPTGRVESGVHDRESFTRHLQRAENTGQDIIAARDTLEAVQASGQQPAGAAVDDLFPTRPGPLCSYCDWRARCPAGLEQPAADPETLLDRWETTL